MLGEAQWDHAFAGQLWGRVYPIPWDSKCAGLTRETRL